MQASESKPLLASLPNDDNEENEDNEDAVEDWIIEWTRRDRKIYLNDDQIVLSSLCESTLEFIFTPYRWIQFVASIQLIVDIIRLSPSERKAMKMCYHGLFRRHLGNGYFIVVMYHYSCLVLDFRQPCKVSATGRRTFSAIFPSRKGIEINLHDEWEYLLNEVIPGIFHNHPKFTALLPRRRECLYGDGDRCRLGRKSCMLCNPFGHVAVKTESVTI